MGNKRTTKKALFTSAVALLLCISMLLGTTFAWFTDSVTSGSNIIQSGNLDIEMYWTDDLSSGTWHNVEEAGYNTIFSYDKWEPGYTDVKYIKLVNNGNLALNYELALTPQGSVGKLAEVINVYFADEAVDLQQREDLSQLGAIGLLSNVMNGGATASGTLLPNGKTSPLHPTGEVVVTIAMSMITTAGNEYQEKNSGKFTITALATQASFEKDSIGSDYDSGAEFPTILTPGSVSVPVAPVDGKVPAGGINMNGDGISAFVPEGVAVEPGADKLTLSVTPMENTTSDITVINNEILIPVDVHVAGVAEGNTVPIVVNLGEILPKYLNMGNYHLYHVEDGVNSVMTLVDSAAELTAHNRFTYDPLTGAVSVAMASFSEVALLAEIDNAWEGKFDYSWYEADTTELTIVNADQLAAFGAIVGGMADDYEIDDFAGKTVKLIADINLGDKNGANDKVIFYPIGYYNSDGTYEKTNKAITSGFMTFKGTFDGNGHTIANFYQNTWEMKGDNEYYAPEEQCYRDGMGLFGKVYGGTVKNLTVSNFSSDGEYNTTGVIAAYADFGATFENIAITNCNPRVYNIGNGGIVGCVGWYTEGETDKKVTFTNVTVDNSNKISALWGSWDVACGGIVGQYYPTSGQTEAGNPKNAGVAFTNCHVSAQIDVYNDVCANYQYYAYRYAGMMIGSVRENTTNDEGKTIPKMDGIEATGCTVNYGNWNDYYYCELVVNSIASYTHDYQFSRLTQIKDLSEIKEGDTWTKTGNFLYIDENENKVCYHIVEKDGKLTRHLHTDAGKETVNGTEMDVENHACVYLPFYQLFTGYGWGVNSVGLEKYSGITTTLGITEGEDNASVPKFEVVGAIDSLGNLFKIPLSDIFRAKTDLEVDIVNSKVQVYVSPADKNSTVSAVYSANNEDWTKGTLTFSGTGLATITITDYYFCTPTILTVTISEAETKATTVTTQIKEYASKNSWKNGEQHTSITMDENITVTAAGGANTGKYYTGGYSWRIYQNEEPQVTVSAKNGAIIKTVKITYDVDDTGILTLNGANVASNDVVDVNSDTITFSVGNTGSVTNGKIWITAIEVVYLTPAENGGSDEPVCEHTNTTTTTVNASCTVAGSTTVTCDDCGETVSTEIIEAAGHNYVDGKCTVCEEADPDAAESTWQLVTDASTLKAGDKIVIVAKDSDYALSTEQKNNNRGQASVTKSGETITIGDDVQILILEEGNVSGSFAFNTGEGYLYAASSSNNYLRTETNLSKNSSWKITIADDGTATIVAQGTYTRNTMQYNQTSSLFACYTSASQKAIALYKWSVNCEHADTTTTSKPASCTETGYNNRITCNTCGTVVDQGTTVDALGHNYTEEITTPADCTNKGVKTYTCTNCEHSYTEEIAETGHDYVDGTCSVCGEEDPNAGGDTEPTEPVVETLTITGTTGTMASDNSSISWSLNNVTFTNEKDSTAIRTSDSDHYRVYSGSTVTIAVNDGAISEIVITCTSSSYANVMKTSLTNAKYTATVSDSIVTVTLNPEVNSITFTASAQTRLKVIKVTYTT